MKSKFTCVYLCTWLLMCISLSLSHTHTHTHTHTQILSLSHTPVCVRPGLTARVEMLEKRMNDMKTPLGGSTSVCVCVRERERERVCVCKC
jgi:hypothetical protein